MVTMVVTILLSLSFMQGAQCGLTITLHGQYLKLTLARASYSLSAAQDHPA